MMSRRWRRVLDRLKGLNVKGKKKANEAKSEIKRSIDKYNYNRLDKDEHLRPWDVDSFADSDSEGESIRGQAYTIDNGYGKHDLDLRVQAGPSDAFGLGTPRKLSQTIATPGFIDFKTSLRGTFTGSSSSLNLPKDEQTDKSLRQSNLKRSASMRFRKLSRALNIQ
ncbi:uncharacterized protein LOC141914797 isoform X2 [Tubulanus polymorphus]|uniref:uncharacterized protein LOC141914797 isoform X2 n=1 Tax=Tubulanus polymorphus TaxID=672921 RepID=UPI003DA45B64